MGILREDKENGWLIYSSWRVGPSRCPALNKDVYFTLKGWNHLIRPGGMKRRDPKDLHRRLAVLPLAKQIIEKSTTIQNITRKGKTNYFVLEAMMPIKEKGLATYKKVRVILYEDRAGVIKFLSVMPRRQK